MRQEVLPAPSLHDLDPADYSDCPAARGHSRLALQPELGLLPEWGVGVVIAVILLLLPMTSQN